MAWAFLAIVIPAIAFIFLRRLRQDTGSIRAKGERWEYVWELVSYIQRSSLLPRHIKIRGIGIIVSEMDF
jgi:hypothetical protein